MTLKKVFGFLFDNVASLLINKFTGKITITLNCKNGNVGIFNIQSEKMFNTKDICNSITKNPI